MNLKINLLILLYLFCSNFVLGQNINIDNSIVVFNAKAMGLAKVSGTFTGMNGAVVFDEDNLEASQFNVCIDVASINSGNHKRDDHLKSEDFFHVDKYPTICFESNGITKTSTGYVASGVMTMHGISKTIDIPFTFQNNTFEGKIEVRRRDYDVGPKSGIMASKKAMIEIKCVIE